jgi:NADPH:quinone reductase-like Zn-dependent oxidoreductase/NAD(P)-dependent dehydrogenase (short-subunit alcohol dehydrogenase family)/acyl carrier protein
LVDFDSRYDDAGIDALVSEFLADDAEDEVAFRSGRRFVHRLSRLSSAAIDPAEQAVVRSATVPFELEIPRPGDLSSIRFAECARRTPAPDEVELRILGVSINFKDVLKAMGVLSDSVVEGTFFANSLGMEAAVEVIRVGDQVEKYAVGDRLVAALPQGCFRSYTTVLAKDVYGVPALENYDALAQAGALTAFITTYYSLHRIARLRRGERVLLHAASGGVGLAAIQVARWCGAEVIATAGSETKRAYLRSLGVEHVFDSRSLDFVDDVKRVTNGEGVDVVLNFLTGEAQDKSVSLLKSFGRFVEIGKRDIDENRGLGLRPFHRNLTFAAVDIDRLIIEKPDLFEEILNELWKHFVEGIFTPLPVTEFGIAQLGDAFHLMRRAEHIGKVVVRIDGEKLPMVPAKKALFRANGTYLITGGFGALGLKVAEWMAQEGARTLVLLGRSGAANGEAAPVLERLAKRGVHVVSVSADITDERALRTLFDRIATGLPPLRGVFHAAAVLDDALLVHLDPERFARVMKAKAEGAWILHRLTRGLALDYFVLFSSVSALIGNPGQANYGAANAFLDSLARFRAAQGLPATSINWGAIAEVGMAARDPAIEEWLNRVGIGSIPPAVAVKALGDVLRRGDVAIGIVDIDWRRWVEFNARAAQSPKYSELIGATRGADGASHPIVGELSALDPGERIAAVKSYLTEDIARVLRISAERLDPSQALTEMGVDSLVMVEVQLAIEKRFGVNIPLMELSRDGSVAALAGRLLAKLQLESSAPVGDTTGNEQLKSVIQNIAHQDGDRILRKILGGETVDG